MNLLLWIISFVPVPKNNFPVVPAFTQCQITYQKPYYFISSIGKSTGSVQHRKNVKKKKNKK